MELEYEAYQLKLRLWDRWWDAKQGHKLTMRLWDAYKRAERRWERRAGIPHIVPVEQPDVLQETR